MAEKVEEKKDPHICGCKTEVFSRCCGYFRPVQNWNIGKKEEFKDRLLFNVKGLFPTKTKEVK